MSKNWKHLMGMKVAIPEDDSFYNSDSFITNDETFGVIIDINETDDRFLIIAWLNSINTAYNNNIDSYTQRSWESVDKLIDAYNKKYGPSVKDII